MNVIQNEKKEWYIKHYAYINCIMKILHKTLALSVVMHYQFQIISFLSFLYQKISQKICASSKITSSSGIDASDYHPNILIPHKMVIVISYQERHGQGAVFKIQCLSLWKFAFATHKVCVAKNIRLSPGHFFGKDGCLCSICPKFNLLQQPFISWLLPANLSLAGRQQQCNGPSLKQPGFKLNFHIHNVESKHIWPW